MHFKPNLFHEYSKTSERTANCANNNSSSAVATITIETQNSSFELHEGKNLLDALLETGHPIEYQCRNGYCGSCRIEVQQGAVEYDDFPLAHLNDDEILPCCCRVTEPLKIAVQRFVDETQQGNLFEKPIV